MPRPSSPHPGSEGQVEASGLVTANFFLSCCDFLGLRQMGCEQAAKELFLAYVTLTELGGGAYRSARPPLVIYGEPEAQKGQGACPASHIELEGDAKAPEIPWFS